MGHASFRITHGSGGITLHRPEISLAFNQGIAHGPGLSHVHERRVDRLVTVGVVVTHGFPDDLGALDVLFAGTDAEVVHRVKDAALGRFESVSNVGQRTRDDDRHGVIEKRVLDFVGDVDLFDPAA